MREAYPWMNRCIGVDSRKSKVVAFSWTTRWLAVEVRGKSKRATRKKLGHGCRR